MTWLIWRQHRAEAFALALLVAVLGAVLLLLGLPMHASYPDGSRAAWTAPRPTPRPAPPTWHSSSGTSATPPPC